MKTLDAEILSFYSKLTDEDPLKKAFFDGYDAGVSITLQNMKALGISHEDLVASGVAEYEQSRYSYL